MIEESAACIRVSAFGIDISQELQLNIQFRFNFFVRQFRLMPERREPRLLRNLFGDIPSMFQR